MPGIQVEVATLNPILSSIRSSKSERKIDLLGFYMNSNHMCLKQKCGSLRYLLLVKGLVFCFHLCWSGSILQIRTNVITVGSNSWLLTCSSDKTLNLPSSYTVSALQRELNFHNDYLSLLHFCPKNEFFHASLRFYN